MNVDASTVLELGRLTTILVGIIVAGAVIVGVVSLFKAPEPTTKIFSALVQSDSVLRMATALIIVLAVFGLRLLDKISGEATVATLSGIAGYLLGHRTAEKKASDGRSSPRSD